MIDEPRQLFDDATSFGRSDRRVFEPFDQRGPRTRLKKIEQVEFGISAQMRVTPAASRLTPLPLIHPSRSRRRAAPTRP